MANTEILKTLQLVREAKSAVQDAKMSASAPDIATLQRLDNCLEKLEGHLICAQLDAKIKELQQSKKKMDDICKNINADIASLKNVAEKVALAAKAVGILVTVVTNAANLAALA